MKKSKDSQYTIRLTAEEKALIEGRADSLGMRTAAFIRSAALLAVKSSATRDELLLAGIESKKEVKRKSDPEVRSGETALEQLALRVDELEKKLKV